MGPVLCPDPTGDPPARRAGCQPDRLCRWIAHRGTGGVVENSVTHIGTITPGILAGILFLGIIATALAMVLWNTSFAMLDASVASLTFFAQPVVGTLLGWFFLKETITPLFLLGGLLIAIGLLAASQ